MLALEEDQHVDSINPDSFETREVACNNQKGEFYIEVGFLGCALDKGFTSLHFLEVQKTKSLIIQQLGQEGGHIRSRKCWHLRPGPTTFFS